MGSHEVGRHEILRSRFLEVKSKQQLHGTMQTRGKWGTPGVLYRRVVAASCQLDALGGRFSISESKKPTRLHLGFLVHFFCSSQFR